MGFLTKPKEAASTSTASVDPMTKASDAIKAQLRDSGKFAAEIKRRCEPIYDTLVAAMGQKWVDDLSEEDFNALIQQNLIEVIVEIGEED